MTQVAQQDYLVIKIEDIEEVTPEERAKIRDLHARGVLFDAFIDADGFRSRIIADAIESNGSIVIFSGAEQALVTMDVSS